MQTKTPVAEVWIVNLPENAIEVFTQPENGVYQNVQIFGRGETLTAATLPNLVFSVGEILSDRQTS